MVSTCLAGCEHFQVFLAPARTPAPAPMRRWAGTGDRVPGGGDRRVKVPKTRPLLSQRSRLCLAGMRLLGAAQGVSDAGSCRARAGQATHAWQPARGAISVHRRTGRALQAVIASLSPPGRRKMIPPGLRALPCCCLAHFCSAREHLSSSGSWPSQCFSPSSPIAAPRSPHHLVAGPKAACRNISHISFPRARQHWGSHSMLQIPSSASSPMSGVHWRFRGVNPKSHLHQFAGEVTLSKLGSGKNSSPGSSLHTLVRNVLWSV